MSKYNPLYHSIWTDSQFENYSKDKKLLFIFLLTNHLTHKTGIYTITIKQISFYTDLDKIFINEAINELINELKIKYDAINGIIFIRNLYKYQKGMIKNQKVMLLSIKRHYELLNTDFWQDFFEIYKEDKTINFFINEIINGSLMDHQLYINNNININKDNNKNKDKKHLKKKPKIKQNEEQFQIFWNQYDYKKSKSKAEASFKTALKKESFENIIAGLENYIKNRGTDPKFWKHPTTWLNSESWSDEYKTNHVSNTPKQDTNQILCDSVNKIAKGTLITKIMLSGSNKAALYFDKKEDYHALTKLPQNLKDEIKQKIYSDLGINDFEYKY